MRIKLRLEPYDPDARDADGDGIVQEGTAWERPAGAKILDDLGNEIKRGLTSPYRNTSWKLVDKDGNDLNYRPTYGNDADLNPKDAKPTLEKLGYRTIEQMGIPVVKDLVLPSTKPQQQITEEGLTTPSADIPDFRPVQKPKYPRTPPAHAMTGLAEEIFGKAKTWEEFREIMKDTDIVFLDYETTGIVFDEYGRASSNGRPTQIGAVRMRNGKVIDRFNVFVNPGIHMSEWEQWSRENLTDDDGNPLTDEFFDDKPSMREAHQQLLDFIGDGAILGMQNAVFDDAVLAQALDISGIDWKPEGIIDTKEMSSMVLPRWTPENPDGPNKVDPKTGETVPSNGLADITRYLGVDLGDKHHSADYDAEATGNVLTNIVEGAIEKGWSTDFLDKEKRDSKIRANEERFQQEIEDFEKDKALWIESQEQAKIQTRESMQGNLSSLFDELREEGDGWLAGGKEAGELMRQWEEGELPEDFDDSMLDEQMFAIGEEAREARFQRLEYTVSPEGAETLRVWIDGRDGATYSIRDEIEDRFLKPEDRAGQLADLASTDRNSDEWKQEYESQLSRIQRIQYRSDGVEALLEMIDNSPIQEQPLYRGMMLSPEQLDKLVQSGRINFPIGATSSRRNSALEYAGRGGNQSVVFEIEGARAFPAHLFSRVDENEFLVSGEFEIVNLGQEDSPFGSVSVVKIRPTGRTYREHGRELLSGRDSGVVAPDGPDLHVQEIQAKQSADEASKILARPDISLTPTQERSIAEISKLFDLMRAIDSVESREAFIYEYGGDQSGFVDPNLDDVDTVDLRRHKNKLVAGLLPAQIYDRDGVAYDVKNDFIGIDADNIVIEGDIEDASGMRIGSFSRRIRLDANNKLVAHHILLRISDDNQNKGIASAFNSQLEVMYRALNVDRVEVDASSSITEISGVPVVRQRGVSFWPRQGFDWPHPLDREEALTLFERLIPEGAIDGSMPPNPSRAYVVGLSDGKPPTGPDRQDLAYFSSVDEWDSFVKAYIGSRDIPFDDPNRPVAGDLMRWAGADEWVAKRSAGFNPTYSKQLRQTDVTSEENAEAISQVVQTIVNRNIPLSENQIRSLGEVAPLFEGFLKSGETLRESLDFGYVEADLADDEDAQLTEAQRFGLTIIGLFEGSIVSRDGSLVKIEPRNAYSVFSSRRDYFSIIGVLVDKDGTTIGRFSRTLRLTRDDDGKPVISAAHDELKINPGFQGRGIGSSFNSQMESIYRDLGVSYIELNGTSGGGSATDRYIGATHWPRAGYDWDTDFSKDEFLRVLDDLVIFDDETDSYAPSGGVYVEGLSSGKRPIGPDRRTIAYFSSVEEWENFVELLNQSRGELLRDENRVVAGDLVRWDGADDWFAGGEHSFDYVKKLKES